MKRNLFIVSLGLLIVFTCILGFDLAPEVMKRNIEAGRANQVKTEITFPAGSLNIRPDANALCEGVYRYSRDYWKPEISYNEESGTGYLDIDVEDFDGDRHYHDSDENEWLIAFNRTIRNDMKVKMIAGESNIDLQGVRLDAFEFEMVAGETSINLRNSSVPFLKFKAVAGEAEIDLTGAWKNDLDAEIKGGVGELTIKVPSSVGVKIRISGGLGEVHAPQLDKNDRIYTNDLYGETKSSLYIEVTGGIGNVNVRMEDR